jgi:hypothetical protein
VIQVPRERLERQQLERAASERGSIRLFRHL